MEVLQFCLLGMGLGALYSLSAQGLVIIYRGSGVLNFAHGAIGMVGAYVSWDLWQQQGRSWWLGFVCGVLASCIIGALAHNLVMRPLRRASPLARIAATLGLLILIQGVIVLRYSSALITVRSKLPTNTWHLTDSLTVTADRVSLFAIAGVLSLILWWVYKYTSFGLATAAVAENQRVASSLGWSPDTIATLNWSLGSALAGAAAILIAPIVQLQPATMTNLVIAALAAALVAAFRSFPIVFAAAMAIGVLQTVVTRYVDTPGIGNSVPFVVIVTVMVVKGQSLPARDFFLQRLPSVGSGRLRPSLVLGSFTVALVVVITAPPQWQAALSVTFGMALVLLSVVVLTGYTGQISLAQYALAGLGAWIAVRLNAWELPFVVAVLVALAAAVPIGVAFALPAVRSRGLSLAVVTLGLGSAIELVVFNSGSLSGGAFGIEAGRAEILGFSLDATEHPGRYAAFTLVMFVLAALAVANVRRGRSGRRMLAVRTNERAAAALGISVSETKCYAFALATFVGTLGGVTIAWRSNTVVFTEFTNFTSILVIAWAVIGGIGYVFGAVLGATLAPSAIGTQIGNTFFPHLTEWIIPVGGLLLIIMLIQDEGGLAKTHMRQLAPVTRLIWKPEPSTTLEEQGIAATDEGRIEKVEPRVLEVDAVSVQYGQMVALSTWSVALTPGQIVGLIGPNGAGKTTAIDAITGFVPASTGRLRLGGQDITALSAAQRARMGLSRSFQSLELFEDMTVLDNLRTAAEPPSRMAYVRDLIWPVVPPLPAALVASIREFDLVDDLDTLVSDLPHGRRRLVAIARAVAAQPSVLLLDEPAAGLGEIESTELAHLVRRLADEWGIAVLLVEHDMNFVMDVCDEIVVLDFGRTIARGEPATIMSDPATIKAYLGEDDEPDLASAGVGDGSAGHVESELS